MTEQGTEAGSRTAPGPGGLPVVGNLLAMQRQGVLDFYVDAWQQYGDVARFEMGPMVMHMFVRPEHVHHVLVDRNDVYVKGMSHDGLRVSLGSGLFTSTGDFWRRQRRLMQPSFTPRAVDRFAGIMVDEAQKTVACWRGSDGGVAVKDEMMRLTMSIISRSMFTADIGEKYREAGDALTMILEYAAQQTMAVINLPL